jgi:hypothetical protein
MRLLAPRSRGVDSAAALRNATQREEQELGRSRDAGMDQGEWLAPGALLRRRDALDRRVAKVIAAEDECRILLDCRKQKNGKPRVLAVVCPKSPATQMQCALFVMKPRMFNTSKLLLRNIVPILSDFHAEMGEGNSVVIKYAKKNKTKQAVFLSTSPEDLGAFLRVASNAHQIALMHVFTVEAYILKKNSVDCAQ